MEEKIRTKGIFFERLVKECEEKGYVKMGYMASYAYRHDPTRVVFSSARYKFVSKMFSGYSKVLEVGCADAFYSAIVAQRVDHLVASDYDPIFIENAKEIAIYDNIEFEVLDFVNNENGVNLYDGIYALDVFEHIRKEDEDMFMTNLVKSLKKTGALILGIPSLESQRYASEGSKAEHVNCKSGDDFKKFCEKYFHNVFLFSMNDEVVHTGFYPMAHYLLALCVSPK